MTVHASVDSCSDRGISSKFQKRRSRLEDAHSPDVTANGKGRDEDPAEAISKMNPLGVDLYNVRNVLRLPVGVSIVKAASHSTHSRVAVACLCSNGESPG